MKEKLEEILGKEEFENLQKYLGEKSLDVKGLYKMDAGKRINLIKDYCEKTDQDFSEIYSAIESTKDEALKEHAIRAAIAAILARDGPAAVSDPELYKTIGEKMKKYEK